jgi:hypothetical protein
MLPTAVFPPVIPSTIQLTAVLVAPVTVATKALKTVPLATVAVEGLTVTFTPSGGGDPGFGSVVPLWLPPQPAIRMHTNTNKALDCFTRHLSIHSRERGALSGWLALKLCRGFRDSVHR